MAGRILRNIITRTVEVAYVESNAGTDKSRERALMASAAYSMERIAFPPFQLDLSSGRLSCGAVPLDLPPKAFGLLRYLAERPGRLVTKEELLDGIWPDVNVTPDVLKVTIGEIRKVLGDSPKQPRFIETAHRRGYRFIAKPETPAVFHEASAEDLDSPVETPPTRYARSGGVNIAYQVIGDGPLDLVFVMGWVSHLDYFWTEPSFARFLRRLATFSRVILFDKRGTGLSDRVPPDALPTLEERMDDVRAVMDAVGSKRAALCGVSEGGAMSALFAATYPERTVALVMIGAYAKRIRDANYPWGPTEAEREAFLKQIQDEWGGPVGLETRAPSMKGDAKFRKWWSAYLRTAASPAAAVALTRMNSASDVREALPAIRVPSLVLHRAGDQCLLAAEGRYVASRIPGARFVEVPGSDHLPFVGDQDAILDEVEGFLTGVKHEANGEPALATVLVGSFDTPLESNQSGSRLMHRLHDHINRELQWFRGHECVRLPRRLVAHFDGPARALRCACAIAHHAARLGVPMKAGLHIGECEPAPGGVTGPALDTAQQIEAQAAFGQLLASVTMRDLVTGSGIRFQTGAVLKPTATSAAIQLLIVDAASS
jgi:pimeloyl-ACP methyl ester carboxylesterase